MSPNKQTQLLVEYSSSNGNEPHIKGVDIQLIQHHISRVTAFVQELTPPAPTNHQLTLDQVTISIKIDQNGEVVLPADGITLHYRLPHQPGSLPSSLPSSVLSSVQTSTDVRNLQKLLEDQKWQDANQETWDLLCRALNKPLGLPLTTSDIQQIPCQTLQIIDQLWQKASQGKFGFGVQRRIYQAQTATK